MRTDAVRSIAHQDLNPTSVDRLVVSGSFADVRRALMRWEDKTYPNRPKYGHGMPTFNKIEHNAGKTTKGPLAPAERKARRMARVKRHWAKLSPEEKRQRREIINARNRANRAKKKGAQ